MKRFIFLFLVIVSSALGTQIDPLFSVDWYNTAVVPNVVPTGRTVATTITTTGDTTDRTTTIQAALTACPAGQTIQLSKGFFRISGSLQYPSTGAEIAGYVGNALTPTTSDSTILDWSGASDIGQAIHAGGMNYPAFGPSTTHSVSNSPGLGATTLTVDDGTDFTVGQVLLVRVSNQQNLASLAGGAYPVIDVKGYQNMRSQTVKLTAKSGNNLTISPGLYWDPTGTIVTVAWDYTYSGMGLRDVVFDCSNSVGQPSFAVWFEGCRDSWVSNVKVKKKNNHGIVITYGYHMLLKDCWVNVVQAGSSNGSGMLIQNTSASLVVSNIWEKAFPLIEVNFGTSGCVFAFNYGSDCSTNGEIGNGIDTNHGDHNSFNLYEGNAVPNIQADSYFGSASQDTLFRNWLPGISAGTSVDPRPPDMLNRFTRGYSVLGNILGTAGRAYRFLGGNPASSPHMLGYPNVGNNGYTGTTSFLGSDPPLDFPGLAGTLTTRTDATHGVVTMTSGNGDLSTDFAQPTLGWSGTNPIQGVITSIVGNQVTFVLGSGTLPSLSTVVAIWPGPEGFQELDLDVSTSSLFKANYDAYAVSIISGEDIGANTLANSLAYPSGAPAWWPAGYPWPCFNYLTPTATSNRLPAQIRFSTGFYPVVGSITASGRVKVATLKVGN